MLVPIPSPLPAEFSSTRTRRDVGRRLRRSSPDPDRTPDALIDLRQHARDTVGDPRDPGGNPGAPVAPDVDVDEPGAVIGRRCQLVRQQGDRPLEEVLGRARKVDEVRGVYRDPVDPERRQPLTEGRQLGRRLRPSLPGGRVVDEHLERVGSDRVGALDRPDHAASEREVRTQPPAVGKGGTRHWCEVSVWQRVSRPASLRGRACTTRR